MNWTRTRKLLVLMSIAAVFLAGCGGTSNDSGGGGGGDTKLTLVAYSTPEEAYKELIPAFNKTSRRQGRRRSTSPTRPAASSRARSRAGCRPMWWSSRSSQT